MEKQKIAILGGGVGSMIAALELTNVPHWQERYEITVYQLGWRLGGKGASGRNHDMHDRIEEHGLHLWMGFYENAFRAIRDAYDYCRENNLMPGGIFQSYKDAFSPMDFTSTTELFQNQWLHWDVVWPQTAEWPGDDNPADPRTAGAELWELTVTLLGGVVRHVEEVTAAHAEQHGFAARWTEKMAFGSALTPLHHALEYSRSLSWDPALHPPDAYDNIHRWIEVFVNAFQVVNTLFLDIFHRVEPLRRLCIILDVALAALRGILADNLIANGFESIDHLEFRQWLALHGSKQPINPVTVAFYDACFAYPAGNGSWEKLNMAAGTMLKGLLRLVLTYRKSIMLWMNAGMGDTIFSPCYLALKHRGVKFEFFHKVTKLGLSADSKLIDTIEIDVQATLKYPERGYEPLAVVKGVYSWPDRPFYDQLNEGAAIKSTPINNNLESWWTACRPVDHKVLRREQDFHLVVNGISLGALPIIAEELIAASPQWARMVAEVQTVRTQAFQIWLHKTSSELGWNPGPTEQQVLDGFTEPFDTWANLTHLLKRESWQPEDRVRSLAYFCNAAPTDPYPAPFSDPAYPAAQTRQVETAASDFLSTAMQSLWPNSADATGCFDRSLLASEFYRINIDPTELYVLSVAGSTEARLAPGRSGFENLYLAGDWTRVDLNIGCVEAAVQSGMLAANAICGSPRYIFGAFGVRIPITEPRAAIMH
jgi:uncharacterized protein with NAD-binding domain and iron-sulfur cluster